MNVLYKGVGIEGRLNDHSSSNGDLKMHENEKSVNCMSGYPKVRLCTVKEWESSVAYRIDFRRLLKIVHLTNIRNDVCMSD